MQTLNCSECERDPVACEEGGRCARLCCCGQPSAPGGFYCYACGEKERQLEQAERAQGVQ